MKSKIYILILKIIVKSYNILIKSAMKRNDIKAIEDYKKEQRKIKTVIELCE